MEPTWIIVIVVAAIIGLVIRIKTYTSYRDRVQPYVEFYNQLLPVYRELTSMLVTSWRVQASEIPTDMAKMAMRVRLVDVKHKALRMAVPNSERKVHSEFLRLIDTFDVYLGNENAVDIDRQLEESVRSFQSAKGLRTMSEDQYQTNIQTFFFGHKARHLHDVI